MILAQEITKFSTFEQLQGGRLEAVPLSPRNLHQHFDFSVGGAVQFHFKLEKDSLYPRLSRSIRKSEQGRIKDFQESRNKLEQETQNYQQCLITAKMIRQNSEQFIQHSKVSRTQGVGIP